MIDKKGKPISPEKLGKIAEKGVKSVHLSKDEWIWLNNEGYAAIEQLKKIEQSEMKLPDHLLNRAVDSFFAISSSPASLPLHVRLINGILELIELPTTWNSGSPAFSWRSEKTDEKRLSFHHTEQHVTAHIEMQAHMDETTDISVRCFDPTGTPVSVMEVELLRGGRCEESISSSESGPLTINNVKKGPMQLCIHAAENTCINIDIRVD